MLRDELVSKFVFLGFYLSTLNSFISHLHVAHFTEEIDFGQLLMKP